jgi:hypothetical protein
MLFALGTPILVSKNRPPRPLFVLLYIQMYFRCIITLLQSAHVDSLRLKVLMTQTSCLCFFLETICTRKLGPCLLCPETPLLLHHVSACAIRE